VRDCIINATKPASSATPSLPVRSQYGMQTFDQSIFDLYTKQLITMEEALLRASNADEFKLRLQGVRSAADAAAKRWKSRWRLRTLRPQVARLSCCLSALCSSRVYPAAFRRWPPAIS